MAFRLIYQLFPDIYNQAGAATGDDVSDMHVVSAWTVLSRQRYLRQEKCRSIGLSTDRLGIEQVRNSVERLLPVEGKHLEELSASRSSLYKK